MATIFFLSSREAPEFLRHKIFDLEDKVLHGFLYLVLASLYARALLWSGMKPSIRMLLAAVLAASLYGASDELHQLFVPSRSSEVLDWVADTIGASLILCLRGSLSWLFTKEAAWFPGGWLSARNREQEPGR
jgi:VanZ family protein